MSLWNNFLLLDNRNFDFFQVHKTTIQVAEWLFKVIFCLLTSPKFELGDVDVSNGRQSLGTHLLPLDQPKMQLGWNRKSDVSRARMPLSTYFGPLDQPKMRCLKGSHGTLNANSASWPSQNATWLMSTKRCFKGSPDTLNSFSASRSAQHST